MGRYFNYLNRLCQAVDGSGDNQVDGLVLWSTHSRVVVRSEAAAVEATQSEVFLNKHPVANSCLGLTLTSSIHKLHKTIAPSRQVMCVVCYYDKNNNNN